MADLSFDDLIPAGPGAGAAPAMGAADLSFDDLVPAPSANDEGLGTTAWKSLQRGWAGLQQQPSMGNIQAQGTALRQLNEYEAYLAGQSPRNPVARMADDLMNIRGMTPEQRAETRRMLEGNIGGSAANIAQKDREIQEIGGPPPLVEKALQAKSFGEFWQYFSQAPVQFITSVGVESVPQMAPGLVAATVAGPMGGLPAAAGAIGVGSFATDFISKLREGLKEEGVDWSNPQSVTEAMSNADLVNRVTSKAFRHAAPVGAIDAASMGVAGRTLVPARIAAERPITGQLANVGVQMPVQGAMGATGEVAGSLASGEEIKPGEVGAEFFGEFISAPADVATAALSRGRARLHGRRGRPQVEAALAVEDPQVQQALAEFDAILADTPGAAPQPAQDSPARIRSGTEPEPAETAPSPIPESRATLEAQQAQILAGDRTVQMFPAGHPELDLADGLDRIEAANGDVSHYDAQRINPFDILTASNEGRENELLGLGPVTKTEVMLRAAQGEQPVAVTERTPEGIEVRGAAGTEQTAPAQVKAIEAVKSPGNTVQIEAPEQVIADRVEPETKPKHQAKPRALSITEFIARNGGLKLDSDARAMDLHKVFIPGGGPLARKNGRSLDGYWREALMEAGYLQPDANGHMSRDIRNELAAAIKADRTGQRAYSVHDQNILPAPKVDEYAQHIERTANEILGAVEADGLTREHIGPKTLYEAAELLYRDEATDARDALEQVYEAQRATAYEMGDRVGDQSQQGEGPGSQDASARTGQDRARDGDLGALSEEDVANFYSIGRGKPESGQVGFDLKPPETPKQKPETAEDIFADSTKKYQQADAIVKEAIAGGNPKLVMENGQKRLVLSKSLDKTDGYRITSFDEHGPVGHREYNKTDVRGMAYEVQSAIVGGMKPRSVTNLKTEPDEAGGPGLSRFDAGKALSKDERKSVLGTLVDVYKAAGIQKESKGVDRNGNERFGYPYAPEHFVKSDITGAMVRYHVRLPDGRIAHPTELFPNYKQSDIEAEMARRAAAARNLRDDVKQVTANQFDSQDAAARYWDKKSEDSKSQSAGGWPLFAPASERVAFKNGDKFALLNRYQSGRGDLVEALAEQGWRPVSTIKPTTETVTLDKDAKGEQFVVPGAEQISQGELAQRKADEPLKPKKAQKALDIGLFGDEKNQGSLFDARRDLTAKAQKAQPELKARLSAIIQRIAGDHVVVAFPDQIELPKSARTGWGSSVEGKQTAAGAYMPAEHLIRVALNDPMYRHHANTAVHESFHAVEHLLLNDREVAVLKKAEPQLRKTAQEFADLTEKQAKELADYEVRAIAFEAYAHARGEKQPVTGFSGAVRVVFERLRQGLERVRNALHGMGFKTAEDVFSDAYMGKMAGRVAKERQIGEAAKFDARGKIDPVDLSRFLRGDLTAEQFAPGHDKWAKVESYLDKTFKPEQRRRMGQVMDAVMNGDPDMLDTLEGNERAIVQRLLDQSGYKPPAPPKAPPAGAGDDGGKGGAQKRILSRIVPSDTNAKKLPSFNDIYTMAKDDLNPLRVLRNELTGGKDIPIEKDPYKLARLTRGSYGKSEQMLEHGTFAFKDLKNNGKSFKQVMEPVKKDLDGFRAYMAARRTIELAQRGIQTGISVKDAASVVQDGAVKYAEPFSELVAYQRRVLDYLRDSGVVSAEGYAAMIEANKDYVPFFRLMEEVGPGKPTNSRSLRVKDPIKGITGSGRQIIDPVESIIKNTYLYVALAEKNRALTALDDLATSSPKGEQFMSKPKDKPTAPQPDLPLMDFLKANGIDATPNDFSVFKPDAFKPSKDSIAFYKNGKREVRNVDPEVAEAVNAMDRESFGLVMRILAMPARMLRLGATQSPEFIVRNPLRDQFSAFILSENGYVPVYDMLKGLGSIFTHDAQYQNWLKSGGANSTLLSVDRKYIESEVMKLSNPTVMGRLNTVVKSPLDFLRMVSELTENATRVGEFKRASNKGKSVMDAGFGSREVTLDFARIGAQARGVNALIPFFNASIEGTDRETRAFIKKPLATSIKVAAAITLPSVLLWFANHDDDRYKELPQWQKDMFWIVLTKDNVWRIPKPFALGMLFGSVPERALEAFYDKHPSAFKNLGKSLKDAFLPNMIPQFMAPSIEQYSNKSLFTDRPIVPKYLENVLPEYQSTPFTSETAKLIGKAIARMGGDQSSFASPQVIDNYIRSWTGGLGQHAVAIADKGLKASGVVPTRVDPTKTWADIPVVKAFAVRHPSAGAQSIQDFYDTYDERKKALGTVRHLTKIGQPDAASAVKEDRNIETAEKIHKALGQQMKVARDVWLNDKITPDEKRALIDQTYMQAIGIAKQGNDIFRKTDAAKKDLKTKAKQMEVAQ